MHLSANVHIEHPRNFSCQPEGIPCPPGEATHMNVGEILSKQTQGNSTSTDFHCLLNNLAAATSSCSSMSGKSFTGNTVTPITAPAAQPPALTTPENPPVLTQVRTTGPSFCFKDSKQYYRRGSSHSQSQLSQMQTLV